MPPLHKRYDLVRGVVDTRFGACRRAAADAGVVMERMELWQELLEAGLEADRGFGGDPGPEWEALVAEAVERRLAELLRG